ASDQGGLCLSEEVTFPLFEGASLLEGAFGYRVTDDGADTAFSVVEGFEVIDRLFTSPLLNLASHELRSRAEEADVTGDFGQSFVIQFRGAHLSLGSSCVVVAVRGW